MDWSRRIPSGMRCSARCCTTARRRPRARSCTATSARPSNGERAAGVPVAAAELAMHFDRGRQPMAALRYYAEAAEAALLNFSPAVCMSLTERASSLVPQAPEGAERDALELTLATLQGVSAFQFARRGREAMTAFERAYALLDGAPEHPMRGRLLHGFGYVSSLRGEYVEALVVAKRAEALAAVSDDPVLMLVACFLHGEVHHLQGRTQAARSWMERGLAIAETLGPGDERGVRGGSASHLARDAGHRPRPLRPGATRPRAGAAGACARARAAPADDASRREPGRRRFSRCAWAESIVSPPWPTRCRPSSMSSRFRTGIPARQWFRGWADARNGRPHEGYRLIREAYEQNTRLGMRAGASEVLGYAAEALLLAGDAEGAQAQLQEALQIADELGERVYLPQLLLLQAAIARARSEPEAAPRRCGAPSRRRGSNKRLGWNCSRWWTCARTAAPRPRSARPSPSWWTSCPKRPTPSR